MRRTLGLRGALLALALTVGGASGAQALSLLDLDAGAAFASGDGSLQFEFDPGSITLAGALPLDLSAYTVDVLAQGFRITGPLAVADGAAGFLFLDYEVEAMAGEIVGASLSSQSVALGAFALALVAEDVDGIGSLVNGRTGGGLDIPSDSAAGPGVASAGVQTAVTLVTAGLGQLAAITSLEQTFAVSVPEPSTGLLMLAGILGLAAMGTQRRADDR